MQINKTKFKYKKLSDFQAGGTFLQNNSTLGPIIYTFAEVAPSVQQIEGKKFKDFRKNIWLNDVIKSGPMVRLELA